MTPLSFLAAQKLLTRLTVGNALGLKIAAMTVGPGSTIPAITAAQVLLSSAPPDLGDKNMQLTYPRVCIYSSSVKNSQLEKFRSFSGQVGVNAEIWSSAETVNLADEWIHFYVEGVAEILRGAIGDWGDGVFFPGAYDVQFNPPRAGGVGFVESAKLTMALNVSLN